MKIIFVASDFSGLGKGTLAASLGRIFKSHGINVRIMKCDLYFNYDAGTINPGEHGEVYVLADTTETDQDFGIYERFLNIEANSNDYLTSGRVFHQIYLNEREGEYLGQTVSVEHVIEEIKRRIKLFAAQCDLGIVELGATIGDIKGTYFLEACRQLKAELPESDTSFILLSHFPYLNKVGELKTMGCQRSVNDLRSKGLRADVIVARTADTDEIPDYQLRKIELFCEVPRRAICCLPDLPDEYQLPRVIQSKLLHNYIALRMGILLGEDRLQDWYRKFDAPRDLRIALVGKYPHKDAYVSILHQLRFLGIKDTTFLQAAEGLEDFDAVIIPGGWGKRGSEQLIEAARVCREKEIPCLGICLGLQIMVVEYARNVLGLESANSSEFDELTPYPVVKLQAYQELVAGFGGTSRLGNWTTRLTPTSKIAQLYGSDEIVQRHRHRYEIANSFDYKDFKIVGVDKATGLIEAMELLGHPFYIGVQCHPEFSPQRGPLFRGLIEAATQRRLKPEHLRTGKMRELITQGTPGSFLESINLDNEYELRRIVALAPQNLAAEGMTESERSVLRNFLAVLDEKRSVMSELDAHTNAIQAAMREIRFEAANREDENLTSAEAKELGELEIRLERQRAVLRDLRDEYSNRLMLWDSAMAAEGRSREA